METRNILQKVAYALIGLSVVVLIGVGIYQYFLIQKLSETTQSDIPAATRTIGDSSSIAMEQADTGMTKNAAPLVADQDKNLSDELETLNYQLEAAEEEVDMAQAELVDEREKQAEFTENARALQKKMLQDPAMKAMIQSSMKAALDANYGSLFTRLGLSGEQMDAFKELLMEQQMAALDIGQEILGESPSEEKKAKIQQLMEAHKAEYDERISTFLGPENYDTFQAYEERIRERQTVAPFFESLGPDEKLTEAQQEHIIDVMYQGRKTVEAEYDLGSDELEASLNEAVSANSMERLNRTFDGYVDSVQSTLTESQAQQFETYMQSRREMMEMSLKLAQQLYGGESASPQPPENTMGVRVESNSP